MKSSGRVVPPARRGRSSNAGWPLLLVLAGGFVAVAASWFALSNSFGGNNDRQDYRYIEAVVGAPSRVNPLFVHLNDADRDLASLVFSGLTRLAPDGSVLPDLAETWDTSPDGRTVTFHLRGDARWHDGTPFTSADVIFTYSLLGNPNVEGDPDQATLWHNIGCGANDIVPEGRLTTARSIRAIPRIRVGWDFAATRAGWHGAERIGDQHL